MNTLPKEIEKIILFYKIELETSDKKKILLNELKNRFKYKYLYHSSKQTYYSIIFDNLKKTKKIYEIQKLDHKMLYISVFNRNYNKIYENIVHDDHCYTKNYKLNEFFLMSYANKIHYDNNNYSLCNNCLIINFLTPSNECLNC